MTTTTIFDRGTTKGWAVISKDYKYILYDKGRYREQLYDRVADKREMQNLAVDARYEEKCLEFRSILKAWLARR